MLSAMRLRGFWGAELVSEEIESHYYMSSGARLMCRSATCSFSRFDMTTVVGD